MANSPPGATSMVGPPAAVLAKNALSYTGRYLKPVLDAHAGRWTRSVGAAAQTGTPAIGRNGRNRKASGDLLS